MNIPILHIQSDVAEYAYNMWFRGTLCGELIPEIEIENKHKNVSSRQFESFQTLSSLYEPCDICRINYIKQTKEALETINNPVVVPETNKRAWYNLWGLFC